MRFAEVSLKTAVEMASRQPAALLGLPVAAGLAPSPPADLVLFQWPSVPGSSQSPGGLEIVATIKGGRLCVRQPVNARDQPRHEFGGPEFPRTRLPVFPRLGGPPADRFLRPAQSIFSSPFNSYEWRRPVPDRPIAGVLESGTEYSVLSLSAPPRASLAQ